MSFTKNSQTHNDLYNVVVQFCPWFKLNLSFVSGYSRSYIIMIRSLKNRKIKNVTKNKTETNRAQHYLLQSKPALHTPNISLSRTVSVCKESCVRWPGASGFC